ncbi:hypothetical protein JW796_01665 [Candidatus Dojkabacteria bacterium]|nr:hypothetical protein [Candidatus Dojkabacteria bacterium]
MATDLFSPKIKFGCSFSPEQCNDLSCTGEQKTHPIDILRYIHEELGIRDIRLGLRWNNIVSTKMQKTYYSLKVYKKYLDYCFKNKMDICLNVGPIKVFRWPEEHVPDYIIRELRNDSGKFSAIGLESEISKYAVSYLVNLLKLLKSEYSNKDLEKIKIIQPENEVFNPFGQYKWQIGEDYLAKIIDVINSYFPDVKILLSSNAYRNLAQIFRFYNNLGNTFRNRFVIGYNYYYKVPQKNFFILWISTLLEKLIGPRGIRDLVSKSKGWEFDIEITEAQFEPWGEITSPGNNYNEFKWMVKELNSKFKNYNKPLLVRLWGVERFAKMALTGEFTKEHESIVQLIRSFMC